MLISVYDLGRYWRLRPKVILHVGAHDGEEMQPYQQAGWGTRRIVWVEAIQDKAQALSIRVQDDPTQDVVCAVAWDVAGEEVDFYITDNGQSSSALALGEHATTYPNIKVSRTERRETARLDEVAPIDSLGVIDLINLDIQGAELRALKGLGEILQKVGAIYSEVNVRELYSGCALLPEMNSWLSAQGFTLVDWEILDEGWGDALWMRSTASLPLRKARQFARRRALRRRTRREVRHLG